MCKPVYAIDTPAGRIGIFEGDESEDFHGIRIFWIDENDAVIDLRDFYSQSARCALALRDHVAACRFIR